MTCKNRLRSPRRAVRLAAAALAVLAVFATRGEAQVSPPDSLFVPGDRVPLSAFAPESAFPSGTVVLDVEPQILSWLIGGAGAVEIAHHDGASVSFLSPTSVDPIAGQVSLASAPQGDFTVVSPALVNDLPVATHWDATKNEYFDPCTMETVQRGGQSVGATDGIFHLAVDLDPMSDTYGELDLSGGILNNDHGCHFHPTGGPYAFATNLYALFSDGTGLTDDADVPDFERYFGEDFATTGISDLAAIWLSDRSRAASGYPIAHRNAPKAFDPAQPQGERLYARAPIFQIAHCHVVDIGNLYPLIPGSQNSLASFVLPPGWMPNPGTDYPILFNGFYDIHSSTFGVVGLRFLETLGELYTTEGRRAIGVLWNGGAAGAQTMHRSAYDNAAVLMQDANMLLAGDLGRVVMIGGSRGGTTALAMAANPFYPNAYDVQFVVSSNPHVRPGEGLDYYSNPTYRLIQNAVSQASGYHDAWKSSWVDPDTLRSGKEQAQHVLLGSDDTAYIDANLAVDSEPFIDALVAKGTRIVLRTGTHDFSRSHKGTVEYVDRLRAAGVPVHFEVSYRFGHGHKVGTQPDVLTLLNKVFDNDLTLADADVYYKPDGEQFFPCHVPAHLEAPLITGMGQHHTYDLVGPPGADYEVWVTKLDWNQWEQGTVVPTSSPRRLFYGTLSSTAGAGFGTATHAQIFPCESDCPCESDWVGLWKLELRYRLPGAPDWEPTIGPGAFSAPVDFLLPGDEPVMFVWPCEVVGIDVQSRTGGVSGDVNF